MPDGTQVDRVAGDVHRVSRRPAAGLVGPLSPKHHESYAHVHRGPITKQGFRLVRWAAVESVKRVGPHTEVGELRERFAACRCRNIGTVAITPVHERLALHIGEEAGIGLLEPPIPRLQPRS